jgi:N-sulfoglucosamine sulfohydrolase
MLRLLILGVLLLGSSLADAPAAQNVVLLISDNQNQDDCGCYGNTIVKTPNLDALARRGVRFTDAFATTASCGPSRAVIYSGLQTHANGQYGHGHGIHTYRLAPKVDTVFKLLGEAGYHTALLGKQHTTHPESYPFTFHRQVSGRDVTRIAKVAEEFIQQAGAEPFLLTIGYSDPHPTSIERPGWGIVRQQDAVPKIDYAPADVIVPSYLPDRPEVREGLAGYYQEISRLDHGVGLILDLLQATNKAEETLVIFTSDHGSSEPGAMSNHYEPGIRVPLIVRDPTAKQVGTTSPALVTLADITPTILDWAGVAGPKYPLHGRSMLPILLDDHPTGWDEVFLSHVCHEVTMYYPMRTVRNRRFKLIWNINWRSEYPLPIDTLRRATWTETVRRGDRMIGKRTVQKFLFRDQIELYDLKNDPDEIHNLADDPKYQQVRTELSTKLVAWLEATDDPWLVRHRLPMPGETESVSSRQANLDIQIPAADRQ